MKWSVLALQCLLPPLLLLACQLSTEVGGSADASVSTPAFEPPNGTYSSDQSVAITCDTPGSSIHFTTDGTAPSSASSVYAGPILVTGHGTALTIKALATKVGMLDSETASADYLISYSQVATPTFSPGAGTYSEALMVTISTSTPGAAIRYTTDGSAPTSTDGTLYSGPIEVLTTTTIKAIAYCSGFSESPVAEAVYTLQTGIPSFDPPPGYYASTLSVAVSTSTPGAAIRYTTDGSTPTSTDGTLYSGPIEVLTTTTIKAIAYCSGWPDSGVAIAEYTMIDWQTIGSIGTGMYQFADPAGVTIDTSGHIFVADMRNARIVRMDDMSGAGWTTYYFDWPHAIALDSAGRIYVADSRNCQIVRMDDMTGTGWIKLGMRGSGTGRFDTPTGIALDASGRIYVADLWNYRIVRVDDMSGAGWTTFGERGSGIGQFNRPAKVSVDSTGRIYVADHGNCRIVRMDDMSGAGWTTFGASGSGTGEFNIPWEAILAADGHIYVADTFNHRIVRMNDMNGTGWTSLGSEGSGIGQFYKAMGCAVDASGYIYVADGNNSRIVRFLMP